MAQEGVLAEAVIWRLGLSLPGVLLDYLHVVKYVLQLSSEKKKRIRTELIQGNASNLLFS